ncbi:hypothetical protein VII00023_16410 [Vibrio ichthyoenteri ATCC 700023]|uniref:Uncharacterized protein n=1 Tax=Vibrio ichthyoenteri ATCC 700023 TaxID=870968 RepID=F9S0G2_9VIBR|nr:hypothetical protein [Vibrio ichthyoenteri]EGU43432.1 hypothetical protein VII00023_16410 [Vibrio ichthyoenteri ATCC 700023]
MRKRMMSLGLMVGALLLMFLSVIKGVDDWQSQTLRNTLADLNRATIQAGKHDIALDMTLTPASSGPFIDHQAFGLYYSWLGFQAVKPQSVEKFSLLSIDQFEQQQKKRPLDSTVVVNKANQMWRNGAPFDVVIKQFHLAHEMGLYESFTVKQSLIYYLAHWPELSLVDKKQSISYLLDHERYKMKLWQYDSILKMPVIGERACNILEFNNISPYYCRH